MKAILLIQLPVPQLNWGRQTGNIPLGGACLKQAAGNIAGVQVELFAENLSSYLGDAALLDRIASKKPDVAGFTAYCWNAARSLHLARQIRDRCGSRIVFGGPEITPDNPIIASNFVDLFVCGEGEAVFPDLLGKDGFPGQKTASAPADSLFKVAESPYLSGLLEPEIENMMLLETQRGCPHRCGYCYYRKSRSRLSFADEEVLLRGIDWALEKGIAELYLLDPSLDARPGLKILLRKIARRNRDRRLSLVSEIRAEAVDEELADLFAEAGFSWFEIGLQTTNTRALKIMNRPTDFRRFLRGTALLKGRDILPRIDLILGLPGDNPKGFRKSVDFVIANDLAHDVQVFPLSVLPGTDFRTNAGKLGLHFDPHPPYPILRTETFSTEEFFSCLDYAESRLDASLFPLPDLDLSYRCGAPGNGIISDRPVRIGEDDFLFKLCLNTRRPLSELESLARRLTHPYQVLVWPGASRGRYLGKVLSILSAQNPFTPLEVVFFEPDNPPDVSFLLSCLKLDRPHYLDTDRRYMYPSPGNRAVLFTLVSTDPAPGFSGEMKRRVFWWKKDRLPELEELETFQMVDGILVDSPAEWEAVKDWQDRLAAGPEPPIFIGFAEHALQVRWLELTAAHEYYFPMLKPV